MRLPYNARFIFAEYCRVGAPPACAFFMRKKKAAAALRPPLYNFLASSMELYDDLYFTEHPYGFVCGVLTVLPARDSSSAAFT